MAANRKRGLNKGKGLEALLGRGTPALEKKPAGATQEANAEPQEGELRHLAVNQVQRGRYQPRRDMSPEALEELAESIRAQGVMQPIVVRPVSSNHYEIIAGERRWRAAQLAGLKNIPAVVRYVEDEAAIAMALIENIQREDLNPMEEALALSRLKEEFELTHQQVADAVGKSRAMVTNLLRLLSLEECARRMLEHGDIEMGHERALLGLQGEEQVEAAKIVVAEGLNVRQTEALVREFGKPKPERKAPVVEDPNVKALMRD